MVGGMNAMSDKKKKNIVRTLPGIPIEGFSLMKPKYAGSAPVSGSRGVSTNHPFDPKTTVLTNKPTHRPKRIRPLDSI